MACRPLGPMCVFQRGIVEAIPYSDFISIGQLIEKLVEYP